MPRTKCPTVRSGGTTSTRSALMPMVMTSRASMGMPSSSFRDGPKDQTRNLEIPGSRFARPGMTVRLFQIDDSAPVSIELHAAERAALIKIAHRIGRQFCLLRHRMLAKILGPAGRAIAEVVGAVVVPPG